MMLVEQAANTIEICLDDTILIKRGYNRDNKQVITVTQKHSHNEDKIDVILITDVVAEKNHLKISVFTETEE